MSTITKITKHGIVNNAIVSAGSDKYAVNVFDFNINTGVDNGDKILQLVMLRDIHLALESTVVYSQWVNRSMLKRYIANNTIIDMNNYELRELLIAGGALDGLENLVSHSSAKHHFCTIDVAKRIAIREDNNAGEEICTYFLNLEALATEEQIKQAWSSATQQTTIKLNTEWSAYYISDPNDDRWSDKTTDVYNYGLELYKYVSFETGRQFLTKQTTPFELAEYSNDYGLPIPTDQNGVSMYHRDSWLHIGGIDIVECLVEYYGTNQGSVELDISDSIF